MSVRETSRTGTSPITNVRSPMRVPGDHGAGRVDDGAVAVGGDAELGQARFDAAKRRRRQVKLRPVRGEPRVVRHGQDGLRTQPRTVDGEARIHVVEADQRAAPGSRGRRQAQREHARARAGLPRAGPRQPAPQRRSVEPRGHVLGEREETRLAVEAEQARAGHHESGGVVFAGRVAIVGPEHEGHPGRSRRCRGSRDRVRRRPRSWDDRRSWGTPFPTTGRLQRAAVRRRRRSSHSACRALRAPPRRRPFRGAGARSPRCSDCTSPMRSGLPAARLAESAARP